MNCTQNSPKRRQEKHPRPSETLKLHEGDWPTVTGCPVSNPGSNCANGLLVLQRYSPAVHEESRHLAIMGNQNGAEGTTRDCIVCVIRRSVRSWRGPCLIRSLGNVGNKIPTAANINWSSNDLASCTRARRLLRFRDDLWPAFTWLETILALKISDSAMPSLS